MRNMRKQIRLKKRSKEKETERKNENETKLEWEQKMIKKARIDDRKKERTNEIKKIKIRIKG